jgi:hypothetical protein
MEFRLTCVILSIELPGNAAMIVLASPASTQNMPNFLAIVRTIRSLRLGADLKRQSKHLKILEVCQRLLHQPVAFLGV